MTEGIATPGRRLAPGRRRRRRSSRRRQAAAAQRAPGRRRGRRWSTTPSSRRTTAARSSRRRCGSRPDVPLYLFLGGAAGTSSILGAMADLSGRPALTRVVAAGGRGRVDRLGGLPGARPGPAGAVPAHAAGVQADVGAVGGHLHPVAVQRGGRGDGGGGAAGLVPAAQAVRRRRCRRCSAGRWRPTPAVLLANTAVPSWHAPHKQLPFVFAGSAMAAGGGLCDGLHAGRRRPGRRGRWR